MSCSQLQRQGWNPSASSSLPSRPGTPQVSPSRFSSLNRFAEVRGKRLGPQVRTRSSPPQRISPHLEPPPQRSLRKMPKSSALSLSISSLSPSPKDGQASPMSAKKQRSPFRRSSGPGLLLAQTNKKGLPASPMTVSSPAKPELTNDIPSSPTYSSLPNFPSSPVASPHHDSERSRNFFSNYKASKSSSRLETTSTIRQVSEGDVTGAHGFDESKVYLSRQSSGSSPDLSHPFGFGDDDTVDSGTKDNAQENRSEQRPLAAPTKSDSILHANANATNAQASKRNKPRFAHLLTRTRSTRVDANVRTPSTSNPRRFTEHDAGPEIEPDSELTGLKTAPLQHEKDRSFRDIVSSTIRNRSADRQYTAADSENGSVASSKEIKKEMPLIKDGAGAHFLANLKNSSSKAADGLGKAGKAGKGFIGKITRTGSSHEKEVVLDDSYVCSVIVLPLLEQTRRTRIAKTLEESKDKTEFWMPSMPWRCIDYLNYRGCDVEGLYRIPGSGVAVKEWQRRFDHELDINLLDEPELYDINIIASMFKAWLRELPDEIFPKHTQARIADNCIGATHTPQMLKDELSRLPPYNYYLLFAVTCHLSLLHSYAAKNKMTYYNLFVCLSPCLKIDGFCLQFLICDWKNCWQGCWTEKEALAIERALDRGVMPPPHSSSAITQSSMDGADDWVLSTSDSSKPSVTGRIPQKLRPPPLDLETSRPESEASDEQLTATAPSAGHKRTGSRLPELDPVQPLSPIGL
ncbi:MAG: hypothetical protein M1835_004388 [Candelina submexicana]|nr:MAG: hypothetical protein M1835_004388 [Candelina submexicana]